MSWTGIVEGYFPIAAIVLGAKKGGTGYALIDMSDANEILVRRWSMTSTGYAATYKFTSGRAIPTLMHHAIIGRPLPGFVCDHKNRNRLDNRRCNLRFATYRQNRTNRVCTSKSGVLGVSYSAKERKWIARIYPEGGRVIEPRFKTKEEAITYRRAAESLLYGEFGPVAQKEAAQ